MAGRSDFTSALPRQLNKMIEMGVAHGMISSGQHLNDVRKLFASAHKTNKAFKNKKRMLSDSDKE